MLDQQFPQNKPKNILKKWRNMSIVLRITFAVFVYLGSAASIITLNFHIDNKWVFKGNLFDWFIIILCGSGLIHTIMIVIKEVKQNSKVLIFEEKDDFYKYIQKERKKANSSIVNLAGNLSWLRKEKDKLIALKKYKPELKIEIYYDEIEAGLEAFIKECKDAGIVIEPYPIRNLPNIKSIVVDSKNGEEAKMYVILRYHDGFKVHLCDKDSFSLKFAQSLISCLPKLKQKKIIGLSGINNIGKTSIATALKKHYGEKIAIIDDPFISDYESNSDTAFVCLNKQIKEYLQALNSDKEIILFDRTPIDNYVCLKMNYAGSSGNNKHHLVFIRTSAIELTKAFHLIVLLIPHKKYKITDTSKLKRQQRISMRDQISSLYEDYSNKKEIIIEQNPDYKTKINEDILPQIIKDIDFLGGKN